MVVSLRMRGPGSGIPESDVLAGDASDQMLAIN